MRLLILTQKVDTKDPILGFFTEWIEECALHAQHVLVVCLEKGSFAFPKNVEVLSLGKEEGTGTIARMFRFYRYICGRRREYDSVLVHMNPEYLVLGGLAWRLMGKKIGLWYVHKSVSWRLRLGAIYAHYIFTASKESIRLKSEKVLVIGHAVDTRLFSPGGSTHEEGDVPRVLTVGRLSPSKNVTIIIEAVELLIRRGVAVTLAIVGTAGTPEQKEYEAGLVRYVKDRGLSTQVFFLGNRHHDEVPGLLHDASVFVNLSETGSLDKAVLEAMAVGIPVLTSNEAFKDFFGEHADLFYSKNDPGEVAEKIEVLLTADTMTARTVLRERVVRDHQSAKTIPRILHTLS